MDLGLKGLKVILTGGSRGIGRRTLELFAEEGCDVAFFSRDPVQLAETRAALERFGGKVVASPFDMNDADGYQDWLRDAAEQLGGCDIFVPGASASGSQATGDWDTCIRFDLMGAVRGCEALEPYLESSGHGSVVFMGSTAGVETFLVPQAYNTIKGALLVYAKQLGQAWGAKRIRINTVSPGPVEFAGGNWDAIKTAMPELYDAQAAQFALGRIGTPDDIARTVVFIASPASGYTTGTNVIVDGGYTKRVQF
ncbi:MAG TPA: SDR family oxidoreductase [Sphingomonas sp.]|jgi:NAD(P)-dependent dehydrogenase (short-subunit alcohol dehydrogenase family)|uniref:SDR family NAD(P)-dependent oxidoreductase n=1 Tax=Sphingomonas sp. TaxID=28214 RepID=UPI002EDA76B2